MHPDWQYVLWMEGDIQAEGFFEEMANVYNASCHFDVLKFNHRSNVARLQVLHKYGGLYVDTDVECLRRVLG